jgi:hypothetical protein
MRGNGGKTRETRTRSLATGVGIARTCDAVTDAGASDAVTDRILLGTFWTSPVRRPGLAKVISLAEARDARAARTC